MQLSQAEQQLSQAQVKLAQAEQQASDAQAALTREKQQFEQKLQAAQATAAPPAPSAAPGEHICRFLSTATQRWQPCFLQKV